MKINNKIAGLVLAGMLLSGILAPLSAQNSSVLVPGGQSTIEGRAWLTFTGPEGMRILALAPFPEEARARLERTVSVISSWPTIRITELRAESSKGVDDYVLSFPSIRYNGREYASNVPGGLRLRFDGALMYDFRVRSSEYFVRVRGVLMNEASLLSEIAKAVEDPGAYIAERDPSWLALRIEQLDQDLTQKTEENAALLESSSSALQTRMDTMAADFKTSLEQLTQEAAENRIRLESNLALAESFRMSLASVMNKGFFGGPKALDAAVLEQVLAYKASNPGADRDAAMEQATVAELKPRAKEIDIIFKLWFDE